MDSFRDTENYYIAIYALISFFIVMLLVALVYVACAKKYRLNWFEKNLLETVETKELAHSQEALMCGPPESIPGSSRTLCPSPATDGKFWVPQSLHRQQSLCPSEPDTSAEESGAGSPMTPTSQQVSPFSVGASGMPTATPPPSGPTAIARGEHHVVVTSCSPARPRVASMQAKLDHTKIDTSLYQKESPSEPENTRGSIHATLTYDPMAGMLSVRLIEAQDLQARDFSGTADPYAKIRLLPDRANVWQTRIHKKTLNPVFDEDFVFEVRPATIGRRTLEIIVYDFDAYSRHQSIGGVQVPLLNVDLSERVVLWRPLEPCSGRDARADLGELMISLAYLPSAERLTVVVIKARNLRVVDDTRTTSDPYVKVSLVQGSRRLKKRRTRVQRHSVCPVWNEALTFDVSRETLRDCHVEFNVLHDSLLGASEPLGCGAVGAAARLPPAERDFFREVMQGRAAVAHWLPLSDPRQPQ